MYRFSIELAIASSCLTTDSGPLAVIDQSRLGERDTKKYGLHLPRGILGVEVRFQVLAYQTRLLMV